MFRFNFNDDTKQIQKNIKVWGNLKEHPKRKLRHTATNIFNKYKF